MPDAIRINGNLYSYGSVRVKIDGEPFTGLTTIDYGDKLVMAKGYGLGVAQGARGRTRGRYETDEVKLTAYRDSAQALIASLSLRSSNGLSYGAVTFQMILQYIELGNVPINVVIDRCRISGVTDSNSEGSEALMTDFSIDCMAILRNGKTLFDSSRGPF
jgi:hypothetical protein